MYIPASFRVDDRAALHDFIDRYGFATLVSVHDGMPLVSHVPLLLDRRAEVLLGHFARANPHWKAFAAERESLAIFHGPHAYISPSWYVTGPAVPTWNYAVVHVHGTARVLDAPRTSEVVDRMVAKYEGPRRDPWPYDIPKDYREQLLAGIVGFELPLERVEGKFKLGQNRPTEDQVSMLEGLRGAGSDGRQLADLIATTRR
ncbi:MAG TPA: FMN-binding negative transcriptional regulator [Pirellulales bacterium]|nr:FMN-binding negative transcriptional regulator [Pirellulales bacterium]